MAANCRVPILAMACTPFLGPSIEVGWFLAAIPHALSHHRLLSDLKPQGGVDLTAIDASVENPLETRHHIVFVLHRELSAYAAALIRVA
jgi:hypothetical protein